MKHFTTLLVALCLATPVLALPQGPSPEATDALGAIPVPSTEKAFQRFYDAIGSDERAPTDAPEGIAPLVDALAATVEAVDATFGHLEDPDRFWDLMLTPRTEERPTIEALEDTEWLLEQAAGIDMGALSAASDALVAQALALTPDMVGTDAFGYTDPTGNIVVGSTGNDCYHNEHMLIIELGGDDCYDNHAATGTHWSDIPAPVSVIVELGGDDRYQDSTEHPNHAFAGWSQAVGIGGVGILVDALGRDSYSASLLNHVNPCDGATSQQLFAQGVGVMGVGILLDATGNDRYSANNANNIASGCHWSLAYTFAQGVGRDGGIGLLADAVGNDAYSARATELGDDPDNLAHVYAQGSGGEGIGVLLDGNGDDEHYAYAYSAGGFATTQKGSHAYVFAQGSNWKTYVDLGVTPVCVYGVSALVYGVNDVCADTGIEGCSPGPKGIDRGTTLDCKGLPAGILADLTGDDDYVMQAHADSSNACTYTARSGVLGQGSSGWNGVGMLLDADAGYRDRFDAHADADAGYCLAFAHTYAQGYAGEVAYDRYDTPYWSSNLAGVSVGSLLSVGPLEPSCVVMDPIKVDWLGGLIQESVAFASCKYAARTGLIDSFDHYSATADADGDFRAEARTFAQGMASHQSGLGGLPTVPPVPPVPPTPVPPGIPPKVPPTLPPLPVGPVKDLVAKLVDATTPASSDAVCQVICLPYVTAAMIPVGVHVDTSGHDTYYADARANAPNAVSAHTYGQGAAIEGIGVLSAVGGDDDYTAHASENGVSLPGNTHVQAYTESAVPSPLPPSSVCIAFAPSPPHGGASPQCFVTPAGIGAVGVIVDLFGQDQYSEAAERGGCQRNGHLLGDWPVGPFLGTPSGLGPSFWGTALTWPCTMPGTPTTGDGLSIGADLWSDNKSW